MIVMIGMIHEDIRIPKSVIVLYKALSTISAGDRFVTKIIGDVNIHCFVKSIFDRVKIIISYKCVIVDPGARRGLQTNAHIP